MQAISEALATVVCYHPLQFAD